jgi:apolipoprotein N-acyltransferase
LVFKKMVIVLSDFLQRRFIDRQTMRPNLMSGALSVIVGCIAPAAWAPLGLPVVGLFATAVLAALVLNSRNPSQAMVVALAYGVGLHLKGHGWMFDSLMGPVHAGWLMSVLGTSLFVLYLALFTAIPAAVFKLCIERLPVFLWPWVFAACMTLGEFARTLIFNGFSGLSLGYVLVEEVPKHWLPAVGVYGLGWLAYLTAASVAVAAVHCAARHVLAVLVYAAVLYGGGFLLAKIQWVAPVGESLKFRLLQSNVRQDDKFRPEHRLTQLSAYMKWIRQEQADLTLTPETAFPIPFNEIPIDHLQTLQTFSQDTGTHLFWGAPVQSGHSDGFNALFHFNPQGQISRYNKVRLMPFGEYTPMGLGWFSRRLTIPYKDLTPGEKDQRPFDLQIKGRLDQHKVGTLICHEDFFGSELHRWLPHATVLLNPSNLSWFDSSDALVQGLQILSLIHI